MLRGGYGVLDSPMDYDKKTLFRYFNWWWGDERKFKLLKDVGW